MFAVEYQCVVGGDWHKYKLGYPSADLAAVDKILIKQIGFWYQHPDDPRVFTVPQPVIATRLKPEK